MWETSHNPIGLDSLLQGFCVVFIVCNVSFIVCVALCAVSFEGGVIFPVIRAYLFVVSYCSPTATG
jgi:hypothetical protein